MSKKFEQLLDLIVNEEMDKANELFHEIVVEKSRNIYENLIAQEAADEEEVDESSDEEVDESANEEEVDESTDEEEVDEGADEQADEGMEELEDSYMMDGNDDVEASGPEQADDLGADVGEPDDFGGEMGAEEPEDEAMMDIKNAIEELQAAFAELEASKDGPAADDEFGADDDFDADDDEKTPEMMGTPAFEGRRMTREYTEKVGNDWEKNSQKAQGKHLGAGTGEEDSAPSEGKSPISSGKGKPTTGANASNILKGGVEGQSNTGTSPGKVQKGINPESGEKFAKGMHNVDGVKSGVKTLSKVAGGHGAEKKGAGPGPVGAGTGDKAGQTSVAPETKKQFLPQYGKK